VAAAARFDSRARKCCTISQPVARETPPGDARPRVEDIVAFRITGDRIVKLHVATWHAGPHFLCDECRFFNLENPDTERCDFHVVPLPAEMPLPDLSRRGLMARSYVYPGSAGETGPGRPIDSELSRLADTGETCTLQPPPPSGTEIYALARSST